MKTKWRDLRFKAVPTVIPKFNERIKHNVKIYFFKNKVIQ
jgi:hypothetical protein